MSSYVSTWNTDTRKFGGTYKCDALKPHLLTPHFCKKPSAKLRALYISIIFHILRYALLLWVIRPLWIPLLLSYHWGRFGYDSAKTHALHIGTHLTFSVLPCGRVLANDMGRNEMHHFLALPFQISLMIISLLFLNLPCGKECLRSQQMVSQTQKAPGSPSDSMEGCMRNNALHLARVRNNLLRL